MKTLARVCLALVVLHVGPARAADPVRVGVLPFDFATEQRATTSAADALARLMRAEMIKARQLQPVVLEPPPGKPAPLAPSAIVVAAAPAEVDLVVSGTVLEATTERSSNRASTYGLPTGGYGNVGASVTKVKARVVMQVELVDPATGQTFDSFEVEGSNTDVGVGADIYTTLGSFGSGDSGWDKSPMGKALREAAQKGASEVARRAAKRAK
jgi:curli biogenesis system outer membrane secretion channel CsgG